MAQSNKLRLGVNIDHVATVRNARGSAYPDPVRAAKLAEAAGADGITAHLREDRRHIRDADIDGLMAALTTPLNFEMAATIEMQSIALAHKPHAVCIVPEKREERTTEGGLDVVNQLSLLGMQVAKLNDAGIEVSLFIDADIGFMPEDVMKLLSYDKDIVCGAYPMKGIPLRYNYIQLSELGLEFIPQGQPFQIRAYDGLESVQFHYPEKWFMF